MSARSGSAGVRLEHDPLAAAQEAQSERDRGQQRRHGERDLHAQEPLAGPVDVLELQQQRGLVERQSHTDAERHGQQRLEVLVPGDDRRRPGGESHHDAGHEVVDVPSPHPHVAERPEAGAVPEQVGDPARREERANERAHQVEHRVLARRSLEVAGARHLRRLAHRLLGGQQEAGRVSRQGRRAPPPDAADLADEHGPDRERGAAAEQKRAAPGRQRPLVALPEDERDRVSQAAPPPPPRAPPSPARRAPPSAAAHRGSRPRPPPRGATPGPRPAPPPPTPPPPPPPRGSTPAPPPMRQARRSTAPRSSSPRRLPAVGSLVSTTPGATNTSSSSTDHAVTYQLVCSFTRAPIR